MFVALLVQAALVAIVGLIVGGDRRAALDVAHRRHAAKPETPS